MKKKPRWNSRWKSSRKQTKDRLKSESAAARSAGYPTAQLDSPRVPDATASTPTPSEPQALGPEGVDPSPPPLPPRSGR